LAPFGPFWPRFSGAGASLRRRLWLDKPAFFVASRTGVFAQVTTPRAADDLNKGRWLAALIQLGTTWNNLKQIGAVCDRFSREPFCIELRVSRSRNEF
jgi:hypothetical protein